jgi:hypothetical protein
VPTVEAVWRDTLQFGIDYSCFAYLCARHVLCEMIRVCERMS